MTRKDLTPKEKAKELYNKFYSEFLQFDKDCNLSGRKKYAIKSSLLCVDEIIDACEYNHVETFNTDWWNKVKDEIRLLM